MPNAISVRASFCRYASPNSTEPNPNHPGRQRICERTYPRNRSAFVHLALLSLLASPQNPVVLVPSPTAAFHHYYQYISVPEAVTYPSFSASHLASLPGTLPPAVLLLHAQQQRPGQVCVACTGTGDGNGGGGGAREEVRRVRGHRRRLRHAAGGARRRHQRPAVERRLPHLQAAPRQGGNHRSPPAQPTCLQVSSCVLTMATGKPPRAWICLHRRLLAVAMHGDELLFFRAI
jgi:hypothetical protein